MCRTSRADAAACVGRGCGKRRAAGRKQGQHCGVGRNAERNRLQAGGREAGDPAVGPERKNEHQGAWPKALRKVARHRVEDRDPLCRRQIGNMDDQRIEARAPFCSVDPGNSDAIRRVGSKAIDRFRRHGDALPLRNQCGCTCNRFSAKRLDKRFERRSFSLHVVPLERSIRSRKPAVKR